MAVNYSIPELMEVLRGNDVDLVSDAFRRFPIISKLLVESDAVDSKLTDKFVVMVPDYVNARKANKTLSENLYASGNGDGEDESMHVSDDDGDDDDDDAVPEEKATKKKEPEPEQEDDEETDEETEEVDYHSMRAMDLYKLCQKRGIEAEPKHRTKYYITLLEKADQEAETPAESSDNDDDDDDWDI